MSIGADLTSFSVLQLVESMERAIANVQPTPYRLASLPAEKESESLLELGFAPTFTKHAATAIEVKLSISLATVIDTQDFGSASYASTYQYAIEGASLPRTKLMPVPSLTLLLDSEPRARQEKR